MAACLMTKWLEYITVHGHPRSGWLKAPLDYQADIRNMRRWLDKPPLNSPDYPGWTPGRTLGAQWSPHPPFVNGAWERASLVRAEAMEEESSWRNPDQLAQFDDQGNITRSGWMWMQR